MIQLLAAALMLAGAVLALLASVGVLRMPDVFTRMQSSTKASTLGLGCLLVGLVMLHPNAEFVIRAASISAFVMLTAPVSAHVIARAAAQTGSPLWVGTKVDERPVDVDFVEDGGEARQTDAADKPDDAPRGAGG